MTAAGADTDKKKLANLLGLAQRAGKLAFSGEKIAAAAKQKKVQLIVLADDATKRARKNYQHLAAIEDIETIEALTREEIGQSIGKAPRSAVALLDKGFQKAIKKIIGTDENMPIVPSI